MSRILLTAIGTLTQIAQLDVDDTGFSYRLPSTVSLGGGTLTLYTAELTELSPTPDILTTVAVGDAYEMRVGGNVRVYATLSGATAPTGSLYVNKVR